ncbi:MAG TPA: HD domain-containing phosphohydrolase, partial [Vicinamibacterales bacterium]|nr:HD domain-containing phosphohydrolase [Vicinamibacterales bacterium]
GEDGLWLAAQIRIHQPQTAVIMTTGVLEFDAAINSMQSGVVDYLVKPFSRERLSEALNRAWYAYKSRQALDELHVELNQRRTQIDEALSDLELNVGASLEAMLAILRARDPESYEHARRVARIAVGLGTALRIGDPHLSDIERAALLHNLGRLALPDVLLSREKSTLSDEERVRLHAYPLHGQAMLKNVPFLAAANDIAVSAHERYDGSGFPRGLAGEKIPLGARILAVADAYDELVSGVGGPSVSVDRGLEILSVERIAEFDPVVIGALVLLQPQSNPVSS